MDKDNMILQPIKIGNKVAPNRIAINAMECCDADADGNPSERTYERYEKLFEGSPGLINLEAITVQYDYISREHQLSIMPHNAKALEKFVQHLRKINPDIVFVMQLTHSGEISEPNFSKRCRVTEQPLYGYEDAELIGADEVDKIIDMFVESSKIAHAVGADGVDLKFCHGYLGSQILRPFNSHNWKYGGSWENRSRFAFDMTEKVVKAVNDPNFLVGSKVSIFEGFPGGQGTAGPDSSLMDLTESIDLIKGLEERGSQYILQSAGSPSHTLALSQTDRNIPDHGYFHHYFQWVCKQNLKPETVVIGSDYTIFRDGRGTKFQAVAPEKNTLWFWGDKNIREGVVDMVCLGRQSFADPYLPKKLMEGRENEIKWCTACDHCIEFLIRQEPVGCSTWNPPYTKRMQEIRAEKGVLKEKHT
ncbi:MAG: 2,4-dienoyl-CoA reductase [Clostridiales bacterium]|nr:2,4-dienoyl-CoA reductase [Clostridiales bacterium]